MTKFKVFFIEESEVVPTEHVIEVDFKALDDAYYKNKFNVAVEEKLKNDLIKTGLVSKKFKDLEVSIELNEEGNFRSPRKHYGKCIYVYADDEGRRFELEEINE